MRIKLTLLLMLLSLLTAILCGQSDDFYTVEEIEGVRYVHNLKPQWGDTLKVALELVQIFGDDESKSENYWLYRPLGVSVDSEGNIYILDAGNIRIQKYNAQGEYVQTIGRRGEGPGEFSKLPLEFDVDTDGNIYVISGIVGRGASYKMLILDKAGKELKRFNIPQTARVVRLNNLKQMIFGCYLNDDGTDRAYVDPNRIRKPYIRCYNTNGDIEKSFPLNFKDYNTRALSSIGNDYFYTIEKNGNIIVSYFYQNRIERYSPDGKLLMKVDLSRGIKETEDPKEITFPDNSFVTMMNIFSKGVEIDNKGRIWNLALKRQESEEEIRSSTRPLNNLQFEIFDSNGVFLGCLECDVDSRGLMLRIIDDRLFLIDRSTLVYEYKIVEK